MGEVLITFSPKLLLGSRNSKKKNPNKVTPVSNIKIFSSAPCSQTRSELESLYIYRPL